MGFRFDGISSYRDFKTVVTGVGFKGDVFYWDNVAGASSSFYVTAIDYGGHHIAAWSVSGTGDQKPTTFATDFPNAIQVLDGPLVVGGSS